MKSIASILLAFTAFSVRLPAADAPPAVPSPPADWTIWRGDARLTGSTRAELRLPLKTAWTCRLNDALKSSPVLDRDSVYVGTESNRVVAIDRATGRVRWTAPVPDAVEAAPTVFSNRVYAATTDGDVVALSASDGDVAWTNRVDGKILNGVNVAPVSNRLLVVLGAYDNKVHAFDAADGRPAWAFEAENYVNGTPAIADADVVFGGCDGRLRVLDLATGAARKDFEAGSYIAAPAALPGPFVLAGTQGGSLHALERATLRKGWTFDTDGQELFAPPAADVDLTVVVQKDGLIRSFETRSGAKRWTFKAPGDVDGGVVLTPKHALFGCSDGRLYVLDRATGGRVFDYDTGASIPGCPAVGADGLVVIAASDGRVYALKGAP